MSSLKVWEVWELTFSGKHRPLRNVSGEVLKFAGKEKAKQFVRNHALGRSLEIRLPSDGVTK